MEVYTGGREKLGKENPDMDDCTHDCASCQAACSSRTSETDSEAAPLLMKGAGVKRVFAVMGGKGGAGRSVTACALAAELQRKGCAAGVLDADITGPSAAAYLGIRELSEDTGKFYRTVRSPGGVQVMASNVVLQEDRMPIAWRGALSAQTAVMFWTEVLWQDLDILFVDFPAGLDDVPIVAFQTLPFAAAVLVSRPTRLSLLSAEKCAEMATASDVPIAALVINGAAQEELTEEGKSAAEALSRRFSVEDTVYVPRLREIYDACEKGNVEELSLEVYADLADKLAARFLAESK